MGTSRSDYNKPGDVAAGQDGGGSAAGPHESACRFSIAYHYEMAADAERVGRFAEAIRRVCRGKTVLEIGFGTGVLTKLVLEVAKEVHAVEVDQTVQAHGILNLSGFADRLTLYPGKSIEELLEDSDFPWANVDVVVAELLSTALVDENQVPVMRAVGERVRPDCVWVPETVVSLVEGVNAEFRVNDIEIRSYFYEFTGIRKPRLMTESRMFDEVIFERPLQERCDTEVYLPILVSGTLNALRFTSIVGLCPGVLFYSTDSLMPPVVVPLPEPIDVEAGSVVKCRIRFKYNTDWPLISVSAVKA